MSAFGVYPVLANLQRKAGLHSLDRQVAVQPRTLRRLAWMCAAQLALMVALDLLVFLPRLAP